MKNNWQIKKLCEVAQIRMGETLIKKDLTGEGLPVYSADSFEKPWGYTSKNKLKFSNGAIVIGARGTIGSLKLPKDDFFTSTQTTIVIELNKKEINPFFFVYFLKTLNFKKITTGTGIPMITVKSLNIIKIPIPSISEQQRIVKILNKFFEKTAQIQKNIEKNLQNSNKLFESYLQSLFANPREDWKEQNIGNFLKLEYGKPLDRKDRKSDGKFPVYGANGQKDRTDKFYYDKKTIIIGRKGSAGEINLTEEKFWPLDVSYFVIFDDKKYDLKFIYFLLSTLKMTKLARGVKPGINRNDVYSIDVFTPGLKKQKVIVAKLNVLSRETKKLELIYQQKLVYLEELKKSVLKKAFNGEL